MWGADAGSADGESADGESADAESADYAPADGPHAGLRSLKSGPGDERSACEADRKCGVAARALAG